MRVPVVQHRTVRRRALRRRVLRGCGETLVTLGVVLLLLVVHQLWWTNRQAKAGAERQVRALERVWERQHQDRQHQERRHRGVGRGEYREGSAGASASGAYGQSGGGNSGDGSASRPSSSNPSSAPPAHPAYAILSIPSLHLRVPVAEGVRKDDVLDLGYAGHYPGTQQPGAAGNFALAGHRNTHGEPFRHLDRLAPGDRVDVETAGATYTYAVDRILPRTSPRDTGVLRPVPMSVVHRGQGYREPGHYLTLTTCTPAYSSAYRLVVWGTLTSIRPR
ncbi:class E sortase [Streptomyces sp. enrichment culture]|uniref:class E sortase n=1 Tax=Streptomyces sp. enrichment culture TaxID=1795815 RepID=UPI003F564401